MQEHFSDYSECSDYVSGQTAAGPVRSRRVRKSGTLVRDAIQCALTPGAQPPIAQAILESLTVLASLRPRSAEQATAPPWVPPASVLRTLQRSLPLEGTEGWYGTLPPDRLTALRDDMTVHVKPGAEPAATPATTTTTAVPATPAKPAATPSTPYTPYSYNYQAPQYRSTYQYTQIGRAHV